MFFTQESCVWQWEMYQLESPTPFGDSTLKLLLIYIASTFTFGIYRHYDIQSFYLVYGETLNLVPLLLW